MVRAIHRDYVSAGADVISTNTFQLTRRALYNHFRDRPPVSTSAPPTWRRAADDCCTRRPGSRSRSAPRRRRPVAVAGAITTLEWCFRRTSRRPGAGRGEYVETIGALADAGCDLVLIETVNSVTKASGGGRQQVGLPCWMAFAPTRPASCSPARRWPRPRRAGAARRRRDPGQLLAAGRLQGRPARDGEGPPGPKGLYPHVGRFDPPEWLFTDEYPPRRYAEEAREWIARRDGDRRLLRHDAGHIAAGGARL